MLSSSTVLLRKRVRSCYVPSSARAAKVLLATQHVGVFRLGNRTVQVLPKIYRADETTDPAKRKGDPKPPSHAPDRG